MANQEISINELVSDGRHFARKNSLGAMEIVDSITGTIVALIKDPNTPAKLVKKVLTNGEEVWVDESFPAHFLAATRPTSKYHPWIIDAMCEIMVTKGLGLTKVCAEPGMPSYAELCRWRRVHPEVDKAIEQARRDRAEYHRDKAMTEVEGEIAEDEVAAAKLKHEAHKWAAGADDAKFSPKAKVEATINAPTMIIVSTGIDRNLSVPNTERQVGDTKNVTSEIPANSISTEGLGSSRDQAATISSTDPSRSAHDPGSSR